MLSHKQIGISSKLICCYSKTLPICPLLLKFILVLEALSHEFRTGVPWELLYADYLAVIADTLEECVSKLKAWKEGIENI